MEIESRRIVHVNVIRNPALAWTKEQIRSWQEGSRSP